MCHKNELIYCTSYSYHDMCVYIYLYTWTENFDLVEIVLQPKLLHLDHQRLYFGISNKTFAWKHIQPASNDNISYKMESKEGCCRENTIVNTWNDIDDSEITLPNNALANNGELVYFNISDTQADLKLDRRFQINASGTCIYNRSL